jgi:hypothetical protein
LICILAFTAQEQKKKEDRKIHEAKISAELYQEGLDYLARKEQLKQEEWRKDK